MPVDLTFSAEDALETTVALRQVLQLEPEQFSPKAFIGMISDEIGQLRARGYDDAAIATKVAEVTGKPVTAELIGCFYAARS